MEYSWLFDGKSVIDGKETRYYCDLGTSNEPWGDLYLKHYGKIFSFTKEGKKVQLLYVSSSNNITIGYKEKDKNVPNDTNLHTGDIGLYAQTVNVKNDLHVTNRILNTYRIGDIYVTSTNSNPSDKLGGTWALIKKDFIPSSSRTAIERTISSELRTKIAIIKSSRIGNSIHFSFRFTIGTKDIKDTAKLFYVDQGNHGLTANDNIYYTNNYDLVGETLDGASSIQLRLYRGIESEGYDGIYLLKGSTALANTTYFAEVTIPLEPQYMADSACDKFYWKRTA